MVNSTGGHYRFESGHHGDTWLDLEVLFVRPSALVDRIRDLASRLSVHKIDAVCSPLTGGAFAAVLVAIELDVEFYYSEQVATSATDELMTVRYRIPDALRPGVHGKRLGIVNDVTSAGSAVRGTLADLEECGARVVAIGSLVVLGSTISEFARSRGVSLEALVTIDHAIWSPSQCPLCKAGIPLTIPSYGPAVVHED